MTLFKLEKLSILDYFFLIKCNFSLFARFVIFIIFFMFGLS